MKTKNMIKGKVRLNDDKYNDLIFFDDYKDIVKASENWVTSLKKYYKNVSSENHSIDYKEKFMAGIERDDKVADVEDELSIKLIRCEFLSSTVDKKGEEDKTKRKRVVLQTGVHGIEGYVGATLVDYFIKKILKNLIFQDNLKFDLFIILNSNPFGVSFKRRVNENNVDLNRNFLLSEEDFNSFENNKQDQNYKRIDRIVNLDINKSFKSQNLILLSASIAFKIIGFVMKKGASSFKNSLLSGQSYNTKGLYYRGSGYQVETKVLLDIFKKILNNDSILIDLHTGYGPGYQMSIVNSAFEPRTHEQIKLDFEYPLIVKSSSKDFYNISGDMIDYLYKNYIEKSRLKYATTFEFGTFGDSLIASLKSVIAVALENQNYFCKKNSKNIDKKIQELFRKAYYPEDKKWWNKAVYDFENAISSICNFYLK